MSTQITKLKPMYRIESVTLLEAGVQVRWGDQHTSTYHRLWLRDSCRCSACFQPNTLSIGAGHNPLTLPLHPTIADARLTPSGELAVDWGNPEAGHQSVFDASWLRVHCLDDPARAAPPHRQPWDGSVVIPRFEYEALVNDDATLLDWSEQMLQTGAALIDNAPKTNDAFVALVERIGPLQQRYHPTNVFVLDTGSRVGESIHHAYQYKHRLRNHTDHVSYNIPPRLQFFGCLRYENATQPGEAYSTLVDGFKVAEALRLAHPRWYELLCQEDAPTGRRRLAVEETLGEGERQVKYEWDTYHRHPVINLDEDGRVYQIRYHHNDRVPFTASPDKLRDLMLAYRAFTEMVDSPEYNTEFLINPGQILVNDNWRILHGRTGVSSPSLRRVLLGAYVKPETFRSRRRLLLGKKSNMAGKWLMGCTDRALERLAQRASA